MTKEQKRLESVLLRLVEELYRKGTVEQVSLISHELIELWEVTRKDGVSKTNNENVRTEGNGLSDTATDGSLQGSKADLCNKDRSVKNQFNDNL